MEDKKIKFGKYKGSIYDDIPATYLEWCFDERISEWDTDLHNYLNENIEDIRSFAIEERSEFYDSNREYSDFPY